MPLGAHKFVRGQPAQGLQALGVVVGQQPGLPVLVELGGGPVVQAPDGGFLNRAVRAFDPAVGPRVRRLGRAVLHAVFPADAGKAVPTGQELVGLRRGLHAVAGPGGVHPVGPLVEHAPQKLGRRGPFGPGVQPGKRRFAGAANGPEGVLAAFFGLRLGEIDAQVADGAVLELLPRRALPVFAQRQAAAAVALEAVGAGAERDKCGTVACSAYGQSSSASKGGRRKATAPASSSAPSTVETDSGPRRAPVVVGRLRHLAPVSGLVR